MNPLLLIPARMASTRLPNKPLADIGGVPMIVRVWARAMAAGLGPVVVAAGEGEIVAAIEKAGGRAVPNPPNGRIALDERLFPPVWFLAGRHPWGGSVCENSGGIS